MSGKTPFRLRNLWRTGASEDDFGPWFHVWGQAVYAHTAVIGVCIASMLFTTVAITFKSGWLELLRFSSEDILSHGEVWRLLSYAVWNPPDIGFAVQMLVLWWFGREIEGFFGRKTFLQMCVGMLLVPALVALSVVKIPLLGHSSMAGLSAVSLSMQFLVAYATLSPQVSFFYGIPIKWVAAAVVGIQTLATIANRDWIRLTVDLSAVAFAYGFVRNRMGLLELPSFRFSVWIRKKPAPPFYVVKPKTSALQPAPLSSTAKTGTPQQPAKHAPPPPATGHRDPAGRGSAPHSALDEIDPLLEKISRSGMESLSPEEKARLMEAREMLLRETSKR